MKLFHICTCKPISNLHVNLHERLMFCDLDNAPNSIAIENSSSNLHVAAYLTTCSHISCTHPLNFLAHLSTKCSVSFCNPSMPGVRRPSVRHSTISLNNISSETAFWILTKLHRNDPWVVPYQSCSNRSSWLHK